MIARESPHFESHCGCLLNLYLFFLLFVLKNLCWLSKWVSAKPLPSFKVLSLFLGLDVISICSEIGRQL